MKILIVKTSSLGDIIHTFPVLEYLRNRMPHAEIDWVSENACAELVEAHPYVSKVFKIYTRSWRKAKELKGLWEFASALRKTRYDLLFDFQGNMKSAFATFCARAKTKIGFGRSTISEWPSLLTTHFKADPDPQVNVRQENLFLAQRYFEDAGSFHPKGLLLKISSEQETVLQGMFNNPALANRRKIMVCPGSAWRNKQLPLEILINVLKKIDHESHSIFLPVWGNEGEKTAAEQICRAFPDNSLLIDKLPLPVLQNAMDRMDLVIAMDSLPLHLAGTTSARTFGIFGPSSADKYKPDGVRHCAHQGSCPYGRSFSRRCPILRTCPTGACIHGLDEEVLFARLMKQGF